MPSVLCGVNLSLIHILFRSEERKLLIRVYRINWIKKNEADLLILSLIHIYGTGDSSGSGDTSEQRGYDICRALRDKLCVGRCV